MAGKAQRYGANNWRKGKPSDEKLAADIAHSIKEHQKEGKYRLISDYTDNQRLFEMVAAILAQ